MKTEYFTNLPHYQPVGRQFFVTFRLHDSLPATTVGELRQEQERSLMKLKAASVDAWQELKYKQQKQYFAAFDNQLDTCGSSCYLQQPEVAQVVANKIQAYDKKFYDLVSYCIMPNHVHLVIDMAIQVKDTFEPDPSAYKQLYHILRLIKGGSAHECNRILQRTGKFWQKESYDHWVRDSKELQNIVFYTLQNPVKARLVQEWQQWKFTYINEQYW